MSYFETFVANLHDSFVNWSVRVSILGSTVLDVSCSESAGRCIMATELNVTRLPTPSLPAVPTPSSYDPHRGARTPLIIDNGATNLRFGFSTDDAPRTAINAVAKFKERKQGRQLLLFGDAIDAESGARGQLRTPWEGDVLLNFDALVSLHTSI